VAPHKRQGEKRCEIQGGGQEMAIMMVGQLFHKTIQVNLCCLLYISLGLLSHLNFFPIVVISWLPNFTSFHPGFLWGRKLVQLSWFWIRYHLFFAIAFHQASLLPALKDSLY